MVHSFITSVSRKAAEEAETRCIRLKKAFARNVAGGVFIYKANTNTIVQITTKKREPTEDTLNLFIVSKQIFIVVPSNLARLGGEFDDSVPG